MKMFSQMLTQVFGTEPGEVSTSRRRILPGVVIVVALAGLTITIVISAITTLSHTTIVPQELDAPVEQEQVISTVRSPVFVHVVGAVVSPGLYELDDSARVIDAVMAAGGFVGIPSECSVNLARPVTDGEQIVVTSAEQSCSETSGLSGAKVSLNNASETELDTLPGIGPTLAARIIAWRESSGPFTSVEQLNDVSGIGDKLFAGVKDLLTL
jgi:competence protein ComEA